MPEPNQTKSATRTIAVAMATMMKVVTSFAEGIGISGFISVFFDTTLRVDTSVLRQECLRLNNQPHPALAPCPDKRKTRSCRALLLDRQLPIEMACSFLRLWRGSCGRVDRESVNFCNDSFWRSKPTFACRACTRCDYFLDDVISHLPFGVTHDLGVAGGDHLNKPIKQI
jgi:hypothetical protein